MRWKNNNKNNYPDNKMTTITERAYPTSEEYPLVKAFTVNDRKPRLIGSAGLKSQLYSGDYDFTMDLSDLPRDIIFTGINDVINKISQDPQLYFVEFKIQSKRGTKQRIYRAEEFNSNFFGKIQFKDIDFMKVDVVLRKEDNEFYDASCMYSLGDNDTEIDDLLKDLEQEFGALIQEGAFFKALKRLFAMMRLRNEDPEMSIVLVNLFNSEVGKLYQDTSQMKAVQSLKWEQNGRIKSLADAFFKKKINSKGSITRGRIDNIIRSNMKIINKAAKDILCNII